MIVIDAFFGITWLGFWIYWLAMAARTRKRAETNMAGIIVRLTLVALVLLTIHKTHHLSKLQHQLGWQLAGLAVFLPGLALAIWARVFLAQNWGMPMAKTAGARLVTGGPYHWVRHPIYAGICLAMLGTAMATSADWFVVLAAFCAYFTWSAVAEERSLAKQFGPDYATYRQKSSFLIPYFF